MLRARSSVIWRCAPLPPCVRFVSSIPKPPQLVALANQADMALVRQWLTAFERTRPSDWPKDVVETSFTRSSGPGGQHVNRTFSKATVRLPLPSPALVPPHSLPHLRRSPYYVPSALLVSSSAQRTQQTNLLDALEKLKAAIIEAASRDLVGETSQEQKARVKGLVAREKQKIQKVKKMRKDVKGGRGRVSGWE